MPNVSLSPEQKRLYLRHLLLGEIGEAGQERLCGVRLCVPDGADEDAASVALDYLGRAGVPVGGARDEELPFPVAARATVDALAGDARLRDAAAALAGTFAAVEAIKACVGVGKPASLPVDLVLAREPA